MTKKKSIPNVPFNTNSFVSIMTNWFFKLFMSIMILYVANIIANRMARIVFIQVNANENVSQHKKLIIHKLSEIIYYIIFSLGFLIAIVYLGVHTATILTLAGSLVVTIGLALQGILANIFSGVGIALADNFRIGDDVRIYVPMLKKPIEGKVIDLNVSYIILQEAQSNGITYVPNSSVSNNIIVNLSKLNL